ncbi:tryptophan--tRNA ligase [Deinococcus cellulosilyticus]|uniref:Tryptophan--tRNA ligase n=1 Tax=Deinococcus cellulosilyticus (strain DSM 18568 / NBRC 106333 / KACC 11606 / 5516J-15) TaxID=1223518 RepID=A0A511MXK5_DEIC1|nr:tryptophan--tRNA ligase [Deinococcus cellulosilyticus]GEM44866.1 tryptophan--tRNA ligase [Deinococcus cellulosilyticus NBRC 106333 = KACC 11606]
MNPAQPKLLTGDRPTGRLHLGHFFGSLQSRVHLQDQHHSFILIADVQALTDNFHHPEKVSQNVLEVLKDNLAVGLSPEKCTFVLQSQVPEIAELTVFFSNLVTVSRLQQNPTVRHEIRQKQALFGESVTYGFLGYPISQAADITVFQAEVVPVGEDQLPIIEQTRELVRTFNRHYGEVLKEPRALLSSHSRIKGLDGQQKMGKSLGNAIFLADSSADTEKKVMQAVTDPHKIRKNDPGRPDICTVYTYHALFQPDHLQTVYQECNSGTRGCVMCKRELAACINAALQPIREHRSQLDEQESTLIEMLLDHTEVARSTSRETLKATRKGMHLLLPRGPGSI